MSQKVYEVSHTILLHHWKDGQENLYLARVVLSEDRGAMIRSFAVDCGCEHSSEDRAVKCLLVGLVQRLSWEDVLRMGPFERIRVDLDDATDPIDFSGMEGRHLHGRETEYPAMVKAERS